MTSEDLKQWRSRHQFSLDTASVKLGCSKTTLVAYERGQKIPRYIGLACAAISFGLSAIGDVKEPSR